MSIDTVNKGLLGGEELTVLTQPDPVTKTSLRARNDQKWNTLKDEIYRIYIIDDFTLRNTKRAIEERHSFKASERKWKEKLKEWNFDKNISAPDMSVLVAKAAKRLNEEGKETVFFMGKSQITRERIEQFKRRKITKEIEAIPVGADTPKNITYHTPPGDSPEPYLLVTEEKIGQVLKPDECVPSWFPYPGNGTSSGFKKTERRNRLSTVLELSSESGLSEDGFPTSETIQTNKSSEIDYYDDPAIIQNPLMLNEPGRLLGHELAAQMDRVISRMVEKSSLPPNPPRATLRRTFRDTRLHSKGCDYFSTGVPRAVGVLITDRKEVVSQNAEPFTESDVHISQSSVQTDFDQLFLADRITVLEESTDSNESEDSFSDTDSSTMSEKDIEDLLSPARLYFLQKQKALELRAKGWSMVGVFQHLVACSDETILEFCQRLWKLCFIFEKAHVLEEALMGFELIQAGYDIEFGAASKETMRCFVYKARILRKMKRYQDSEALYRQAIAGFRSLRQRVAELKCQLLLGTFLQSLERHSEALQFLLEALTEHFAQTKTIEESRKVIDLLDSIRKLHSKMRLGPDLIKSISRLKSLQHEWIDTPNHLNLLSEFVQLGGHYSKLHKYEMADLCFAYPAPIQSSRISPAIRIEALKYSRELSIHYQRQGKWIKSIEHLEHALEQLPALLHLKSAERTDFQRPLVVTDTLEHDLFATLGRLLSETRPTGQQPVVRDSCKHWSTWKRAEAAWAKLDTRRRIIRHKPIRHSRIDSLRDREIVQRSDSTSLSSQGSSGISSGSAGSRLGLTYSVGSASSIVSNSVFMVP